MTFLLLSIIFALWVTGGCFLIFTKERLLPPGVRLSWPARIFFFLTWPVLFTEAMLRQ
jgi:hypothetical protein